MTTALRTNHIQDEFERPIPGASIYIYNADGSLASITSDGSTVIANPLTSDAFGNYSYYALVGFYREDVWFGGLKRWSEDNVAVGGPLVPGAGYNLLANSQWEIWSGVGYSARWKADGTALLPTCSLISHTTSGPLTTLTVDAVPAGWAVGHLVKVDPYAGGLYVGDRTMPIIAIPDGTHIQVRVQLNLTPTLTGTGTVTNVNVGGSASVGTGDAADYWKKPTATQAWRADNSANLAQGALYAIGLAKGTASSEKLSYPLDIKRFAGRQIVFGAWIKQQIKTGTGTHRLYITSDVGGQVNSILGSVVGSYQYLEISATIPANATTAEVGIELLDIANAVYFVINPMLAFGNYLGSNGYTKPREQLIPIVKVEPPEWINAPFGFPTAPNSSITWAFGFPFDLYAASGGQIARSVRLAQGCIEGINTAAVATGTSGSRLIGWTDAATDPIRLGNFMSQQVQNVKTHQPLRIPLVNGGGHVFSGISADAWANVSVDLDLFHLE